MYYRFHVAHEEKPYIKYPWEKHTKNCKKIRRYILLEIAFCGMFPSGSHFSGIQFTLSPRVQCPQWSIAKVFRLVCGGDTIYGFPTFPTPSARGHWFNFRSIQHNHACTRGLPPAPLRLDDKCNSLAHCWVARHSTALSF